MIRFTKSDFSAHPLHSSPHWFSIFFSSFTFNFLRSTVSRSICFSVSQGIKKFCVKDERSESTFPPISTFLYTKDVYFWHFTLSIVHQLSPSFRGLTYIPNALTPSLPLNAIFPLLQSHSGILTSPLFIHSTVTL